MAPQPGLRPIRSRSRLLRGVDPRYAEELNELRQLFVEPEQTRIEHLEQHPSPEVVGGVLPEALAHASQLRGDELSTAIGKPVTSALRDIARREPELFGQMLAPTIGTAVRRAVTDALAALVQRMNQLIERSLSLRSFAWRIEARRCGRPFSEVMLAHTLLYRVEWVVLIHSETSLVLEQAALEGASKAPDQISAMLQAISAFISDAFHPTVPGADLHKLEVGDLTVWVDRGPSVTLAAAIRGVAPYELRDTFRQTLERVRTLHHSDFAEPYPDVSKFADVQPLLLECLKQGLKPTRQKAQWVLAALGIAAVIVTALLMMRATAAHRKDAELRAAYQATLSTAPGIVVTSVERSGDRYVIEGLRDPRSERPESLIAAAKLPAATLELVPFDSLDPRFEGPLVAADHAIRELETIRIPFEPGMTAVIPDHHVAIERAAQLVNRTQRAATQAQMGLCIEVMGAADETGSVTINEMVRPARAANVARALEQAGVDPALLDHRVADPTRARLGRSVTFRATLRPDPARPGCRP